MRYSDDDLRAAEAAGVIAPAELQRLLGFLAGRQPVASETAVVAVPKFDVAHLLWYAGALIVIGAMGLFTTLAFSQMGGRALVVTAVLYAAAFVIAGNYLWYGKNLTTPGGLLIAIAVSMAPLATYGLQTELGWWGDDAQPKQMRDFYIWIKSSWIFMEIATIVAGAIALRFYRFPFIVAIIAFALWFMSMDLAAWIFNTQDYDWVVRRKVSMYFGLGVLVIAWIVDRKERNGDFAFWLHLFGMMAFWGALSATSSTSEVAKAIYCLLNVGLLLISVFLMRRVYAVFGAIGICMYLGHLAEVVFRDSLLFPFALSLIGVGVIALGLLYHRKQEAVTAWFAAQLPEGLLRLRPPHAR